MKILLHLTFILLPFVSGAQTWYYDKAYTTDYNLHKGKNRYDTFDLKGSFLQIKYNGDQFIINRDTLRVTLYSNKPDTVVNYDYNTDRTRLVPVTKIVPFISIDVANNDGETGTVIIFGDVMFLDYLLNKNYRRIIEYRLVSKIRSVSDRVY